MNVIVKFIENYTSFDGIGVIKQGSNAIVKKSGSVIFFRQFAFGMDSRNIANSQDLRDFQIYH